jgi:hypothetical protein
MTLGWLFARFMLDDKLKALLEKKVTGASNGEHVFHIGKLESNVFTQTISLYDVKLLPSFPENTHIRKITADEIELSSIAVLHFLTEKKLQIGDAFINGASIELNDRITDTIPDEVNVRDSGALKSILIEEVRFENTRVKLYSPESNQPFLECDSSLISCRNMTYDPSVSKSFDEGLQKIDINNFTYLSPNGLYRLNIPSLVLSQDSMFMQADSVTFLPQYNINEFFRKSGTQTDRMQIYAGVRVSRINICDCIRSSTITAGKVDIEQLAVFAYRNKKYPRDGKKKKSVQQLIKEIALPLSIDTIEISHATVEYKELPENANEPGEIHFGPLQAVITGVSNDTSLKDHQIVMRSTAKVEQHGDLRAKFTFPMNTKEMRFYCSGSSGKIPFSSINSFVEAVTPGSIKRGQVDSMQFSFYADENKATGTLEFAYSDLKVELRNKEDEKTVTGDVAAFLAHLLVLRENNPGKNGEFRVTEINYNREPDRFIFNYTWKAILSGILPAAGIGEKQTAKL